MKEDSDFVVAWDVQIQS